MQKFDVLIVGGGIAGSITAKFAAQGGLKTLFIEKEKTPRNKSCSGIQFKYFEKILGEKIPKERLCKNELNRIEIHFPNGKSMSSSFQMLNFMRKPFDNWLNIVAQKNGAEFRDGCKFLDFNEETDHITVNVGYKPDWKKQEQIKTRYLIDASGLRPVIRKKLRPHDFDNSTLGSTLNYYITMNDTNSDCIDVASSKLDLFTLYQFWNIDWNDAMFAWVYSKTLDDGKNSWVVGTGCNTGKIMDRQTAFYNFIKEKYNLTGEIVKKEGFASTFNINSKERVWLGQKRILMTGDAAGLIDQVRGVGMDAAALSGRLVAKAIIKADRKNTLVIDEYKKLMKNVVKQTKQNQEREIGNFQSNQELQNHLMKNFLKMGFGMVVHNILNKIRTPEMQKLLPP